MAAQHQPQAQVEVVGERVFVEAAAGQNGIAAQELAIAPQLPHAAAGQPTGLQQGIESHLHRLRLGERVDRGVDHRLAQLHRPPAAGFGKGHEPLEGVGLQIGIGIEHEQPAAGQLLQHQVEGTGFPAAGIPGPPQHPQLGHPGLQLGEHLGRAVLAAVVDDPQPQLILGPLQGTDPLHQAGDHSLLVAGGHHHIHRGGRHGGGGIGGGRGVWGITGRPGGEGAQPAHHGDQAMAPQHQGQQAGGQKAQTRRERVGDQARQAAGHQEEGRLRPAAAARVGIGTPIGAAAAGAHGVPGSD